MRDLNATFRPRPWSMGPGLVFLAGVALASSGCNMLIPMAFLGEKKEKIPAEFDKLDGKRTAVVVWAQPDTLFDYPHVRMELAMHISDRLATNLKKIDLVDCRRIEDRIERSVAVSVDPESMGREFQCDMVVYVELLEFQVRDPNAPDYLRARIHGSVAVYDIAADPDDPKRYDLGEVLAVYPAHGPVLMDAGNSVVVRKEAYELFGEMVARKFYAYEKEM
jgi:hypothetical protein